MKFVQPSFKIAMDSVRDLQKRLPNVVKTFKVLLLMELLVDVKKLELSLGS
jgi:hypothetical protein